MALKQGLKNSPGSTIRRNPTIIVPILQAISVLPNPLELSSAILGGCGGIGVAVVGEGNLTEGNVDVINKGELDGGLLVKMPVKVENKNLQMWKT